MGYTNKTASQRQQQIITLLISNLRIQQETVFHRICQPFNCLGSIKREKRIYGRTLNIYHYHHTVKIDSHLVTSAGKQNCHANLEMFNIYWSLDCHEQRQMTKIYCWPNFYEQQTKGPCIFVTNDDKELKFIPIKLSRTLIKCP